MPQTEFVAPNLWSLSGGGIHVRYWTFTLGPIRQGDEPPHFTYYDSHRTLSFHGNEIRSVNVPDLGTLVSVTIVLTVDTGSTTFTVLLPRVNIVSQGPSYLGSCVDRRDKNRARWSTWAAIWSWSGRVLHHYFADGGPPRTLRTRTLNRATRLRDQKPFSLISKGSQLICLGVKKPNHV